MVNYTITRKAREDLNGIWEYTFDKWSEEQADRYYQLLVETFGQLAKNPALGKRYPEISVNLSGFKVNRHVIFYRIKDYSPIEIIRILHERMDLEGRLGTSGKK